MTVGSLFSGIGGIDLGLERCGYEIRWQCEIDPYCRRVLAKHWPDIPCHEDVRGLGAGIVEPVDVLAGGFPCQPVSVAGKQLAQDDERWLWPEYARLVGELRPSHVFLENVPGLLIRGMGNVLKDLAALGYDAEWGCVSAASVGAPHLRRRVFLLAHTDSAGLEGMWNKRSNSKRKDTNGHTGSGRVGEGVGSEWWATEPSVRRVSYGVPNRVDRLRALGNAVVPQVAEYVGRRLMEFA
jgi:DNA (cytosine-5)-methyltransferase 1